jgi:hypothetical protein
MCPPTKRKAYLVSTKLYSHFFFFTNIRFLHECGVNENKKLLAATSSWTGNGVFQVGSILYSPFIPLKAISFSKYFRPNESIHYLFYSFWV